MDSNIRYPHVVNKYLRGRKPITRLMTGVILVMAFIVAHRYVLGIACLAYAFSGFTGWAYRSLRPKRELAPVTVNSANSGTEVPPPRGVDA
jgi:hypothetical protein